MRKKVIEETETLTDLIPLYAENKKKLDELKKVVDTQNKHIKELMGEESEVNAGDYVVKKVNRVSESFNTEQLLSVLHTTYPTIAQQCIKTQEYVDMDVLEGLIYNNKVGADFLTDVSNCKVTKTTVALTVKKRR